MASTEEAASGIKSSCLLTCFRKSTDCTRSVQKLSSTVRSFTQAQGLALNKLESTTLSKPSPACFQVDTVARLQRNNLTSHQWVEAQVESRLQPTTKVSARATRGCSKTTFKVTASGLPRPRPTHLTAQWTVACRQVWVVEASLSEFSSPWAAKTCRLAKLQPSRRPLT